MQIFISFHIAPLDKVCSLQKSTHGLKQTICKWFACLTSLLQVVLPSCSIQISFIISYNYRQSLFDNSLPQFLLATLL